VPGSPPCLEIATPLEAAGWLRCKVSAARETLHAWRQQQTAGAGGDSATSACRKMRKIYRTMGRGCAGLGRQTRTIPIRALTFAIEGRKREGPQTPHRPSACHPARCRFGGSGTRPNARPQPGPTAPAHFRKRRVYKDNYGCSRAKTSINPWVKQRRSHLPRIRAPPEGAEVQTAPSGGISRPDPSCGHVWSGRFTTIGVEVLLTTTQ
jgi:hypothetical protein